MRATVIIFVVLLACICDDLRLRRKSPAIIHKQSLAGTEKTKGQLAIEANDPRFMIDLIKEHRIAVEDRSKILIICDDEPTFSNCELENGASLDELMAAQFAIYFDVLSQVPCASTLRTEPKE